MILASILEVGPLDVRVLVRMRPAPLCQQGVAMSVAARHIIFLRHVRRWRG